MRFRTETIGDATLILGDCREVLPTIARADMIMTDPPYGHNNNDGDLIHRREAALGRPPSDGDTSVGRPIANDGPEANELLRAVVWDKGPMGMGWHYRRSYETVLVSQKPGAACKWYDSSQRIENIIRPGALSTNKIIPGKDQHPTEKPVSLKAHFIRLHSQAGETVLDPFMGSGSTGVAALSYGRKFIGIELDPQFFDMTCERIERMATLSLFEEPRAKPQQTSLEFEP